MKKLALFLSILILVLSFSGCNNSPLNKNEPVTLTMWHNYGGDMQATMDLLIDEFNSTVGKEEGIIINVTAISSSSELNKSLSLIASGDPGAADIPDIFTGYPDVAMQFIENDMLVNLDDYFTEKELSAYVGDFLEEGRIDGALYVFPIAKSTELLFVNQTLFDEFSKATGADINKLSTFEGIAELAEKYYAWSGGKAFYAADSWFNLSEVGMKQLGSDIFDENENLNLANDTYKRIFDTTYSALENGGIAVYDGYSSDLAKTGDIVCSTGSSAGILFYGDTITLNDGTVKEVTYSILPYPTFEGGKKVALQRGGGLMVAKSNEKKEYAATLFLKWLTSADQNMQFVSQTGYLPVTNEAFDEKMSSHIETVENENVKKLLTTVMGMQAEYEFFFAPHYDSFDKLSDGFEEDFYNFFKNEKAAPDKETAFERFVK